MTHPGNPEEEADEGVLGDEQQEDTQLDRPDPVLRQINQRTDDPRDDRHQRDEHGKSHPPEQTLDLGPEVPEHRQHDHQPDVRFVGYRPRRDPPDLAVEDQIRHQGQLSEDLVLGTFESPHEHADDAGEDDEDRRGDVERADPEPWIVGAAASGNGDRESAGHRLPR